MREHPTRPPRGRSSPRSRKITAVLAALALVLGGGAIATAANGELGTGSLVGAWEGDHRKDKDKGKHKDRGNPEEGAEEGTEENPEEGAEEAPEDGDEHGGHGDGEHEDELVIGPFPEDFADIEEAPLRDTGPGFGEAASTGTFTVDCGRNENGLFNSENVIVAPGIEHGAQHTHDYVGNQDVQRFTEDVGTNNQILLQGETTCPDGDRSMHFWPVLRDTTGEGEDADQSGGGLDGNLGAILTPSQVRIEFVGNPQGPVAAMPEFLQIFTGNARAATAEGVNANAQWTCTGFEDRAFGDRYPLCPEGSDVVRILEFPSCWNGRDFESEDNRSHIVFPEDDGSCAEGFTAVPRLIHTLVYEVPDGPNFALDGFPEQRRAPITDHSDHINVMPADLMGRMVECINSGQDC
ncbi:DUF1996 domain-containing protein [Nocardiopsis valliformis]|uniref:DUF1996 domain-containing protein n=1 Tax=Nocardiopsis valliformis TaxID=239974 RepID=UPI000349ED59|nr:DUF1996 domain-containing protein [Nocardiopsis valliformis]